MKSRPILTAFAVAFALMAGAETQKVGDYTWTYTINGERAEIYNDGKAAVSPLPTGSVTIPGSLGGKSKTFLGAYALKGCTGLKTVTIPATMNGANVNAFDGCASLESISVASGNTAFKSVNGLMLTKDGKKIFHAVNGDVVIPDGVEIVRWSSFDSLNGVTSVTIPQTVTNIEGCAFFKCTALTSVELPYDLKNIATRTFYGCTSLKNVYIGNSVTNIADRAFCGCTSLSSVTIPQSVESIGDRAFDGSGLTSVNFDGPAGQIYADFDSAFTNTAYRTTTNANDDFAYAKTISGSSGLVTGFNNFATDEENEPIWKRYSYAYSTMWFKWTAPSGAKSAVFHTCHSDFNTYLGVFKGSSRSSLTMVAADDSSCDDGTSKVKFAVTGGTTYYICVADGGGSGFFRLYWATSSGTPVYVNAHGTLCGVAGDCPATLNIPSKDASSYPVIRIADCAFYDYIDPSADNITKVTIPDSVTSVGYSAFVLCNDSVYDTTSLPGVTLVDGWAIDWTDERPSGRLNLTGVRGIADGAFYECTDLTSVTIPSTAKGIGKYAFAGCAGLASVTISDGVTYIGESAFDGCTGLTSVTIPDSVTFIGMNAFWDYGNLKRVRLPAHLCEEDLESWVFGGCSDDCVLTYFDSSTGVEFYVKDGQLYDVKLNGATSVEIPNGVTGIGRNAFNGCRSKLESVTIPASVKSINPYAFDGCSALESFTVASGNRKYKSVNGLLLTKDGKRLVCGVNGDVAIPDGVEVVGDSAFYGFYYLTSVAIPASVAEIEDYAFGICTRLKSFTVASGNQSYKVANGLLLTKNGKTLVSGVNGGDVTIPAGVEVIRGDAFSDRDGVTSVTIPSGVKEIGIAAFRWCDGLKTVTFAGDCPKCGNYVYSDTPDDLVTYVPAGNATWADALGAGTWQGRAIRAAEKYKVTFGKNGGTGGDSYVTATYGAAMPTPRTAPTLSGYTFAGYWDTLAMDEKGTPKGKQYYDANMKSVRNWDKKSATTLWAKWTNKVTFGKNGGTGGDNYVTCTKGQPMPKRTMPTKSGYFFDGYWNTTGAGGVKYYNSDGTSAHAWDKSGNVTLWAKWVKPVACKVTFGKNGGTGGDNYVTATSGKPMPTPRTAPKLDGWTFAGYWDTLAQDANGNPTGKQYYDSNMKSVRAWDKTTAATLWAKWTVRVKLGKNGGTGGDDYVTVTKGQPFPKRTMPKKTGYTFGGYFVSSSSRTGQCYNTDGTGTSSMKWSTGGSPTIWALWTKTSGCVELPPAVARRAASAAPETAPQSAVSAGIYSGVLADGTGAFWLMLGEAEKDAPRTAYLYVASEDDSLTAKCTVDESGAFLILTTEDGKTFVDDLTAEVGCWL